MIGYSDTRIKSESIFSKKIRPFFSRLYSILMLTAFQKFFRWCTSVLKHTNLIHCSKISFVSLNYILRSGNVGDPENYGTCPSTSTVLMFIVVQYYP